MANIIKITRNANNSITYDYNGIISGVPTFAVPVQNDRIGYIKLSTGNTESDKSFLVTELKEINGVSKSYTLEQINTAVTDLITNVFYQQSSITGGATAANQTAGNNLLTDIKAFFTNTYNQVVNWFAVKVINFPTDYAKDASLTDKATAANQTTGNNLLTDIKAFFTNTYNQVVNWFAVKVINFPTDYAKDSTVTGIATAANQTAGNQLLTDIKANQTNQTQQVLLNAKNYSAVTEQLLSIDKTLTVSDYYYAIADRKIDNHTYFYKVGFIPDVDNAETSIAAFLTSALGRYQFPAAAQQMRVVSSSANDAIAGTNAQKVKLYYLDNNYAEQTETIDLNGVTPVNTVATNILRVNNMDIVQVGGVATAFAAGNIKIENLGGTTTYGQINAGFAGINQLIYTVPAGKKLMLTDMFLSAGSNVGGAFTQFRFRVNCDREGNLLTNGLKFTCFIGSAQDGNIKPTTKIPFAIPEKVDLQIDVISDAAASNSFVSGWLGGWLES